MTTDVAEKKIDIGVPLFNLRHEKFALAYASGMSATEAYVQAGFSPKGANRSASRLLSYAVVSERVEQIRDAIADSKIMTIRDRKIRLTEIAGARLKDFHNKRGVLDPFADGIENQGAVAQVEQEYDSEGREAYPTKVKLHNPVPAIDMLNKMEGAYPPARMEVTGRDGGPIRTENIRIKLLTILGRISLRLSAKKDEEG